MLTRISNKEGMDDFMPWQEGNKKNEKKNIYNIKTGNILEIISLEFGSWSFITKNSSEVFSIYEVDTLFWKILYVWQYVLSLDFFIIDWSRNLLPIGILIK